jgi:hypothetical protein
MSGGYGAPAAPYAGFPDWQPSGMPGMPGGPGEFINRGDYAQVIREGDPAATSSLSRPTEWGRLGEWSPGNAAPGHDNGRVPDAPHAQDAPAASVRGRAITAGAAAGPAGAEPLTVQPASAAAAIPLGGPAPAEAASSAVDPELAYGPDDPGYGPPGPDWYRKTEEAPAGSVAKEEAADVADMAAAADVADAADAAESRAERGPFEPIPHDELAPAGQPAEDGDGAPAGPGADRSEMPEFDPIGETPDLLDLGPDDPVDGALGGLRSLYRTAEAIGPDRLERNLDQLLDRQRKLITEYFTQPGDLGYLGHVDLDAPAASIGFDSAESLAGLQGELRTSR